MARDQSPRGNKTELIDGTLEVDLRNGYLFFYDKQNNLRLRIKRIKKPVDTRELIDIKIS